MLKLTGGNKVKNTKYGIQSSTSCPPSYESIHALIDSLMFLIHHYEEVIDKQTTILEEKQLIIDDLARQIKEEKYS